MGNDINQLSLQQVHSLVSFIAEDFGSHLSRAEFSDVFLLMIENIPLDRSLTEQEEAGLIELCFDKYQQFGATNDQ